MFEFRKSWKRLYFFWRNLWLCAKNFNLGLYEKPLITILQVKFYRDNELNKGNAIMNYIELSNEFHRKQNFYFDFIDSEFLASQDLQLGEKNISNFHFSNLKINFWKSQNFGYTQKIILLVIFILVLFDYSFSIERPSNSFEKSQQRLIRNASAERSAGWILKKGSFSPDPENGQIRKIRSEFKVLFIPSSSGANAETSTTVQLFFCLFLNTLVKKQ